MSENNIYKLVLYPKNVEYILDDWQQIKNNLEKVGFIGSVIEQNNESYFIGDNFLSLITFLGCSPEIQLEPEGGGDKYCRIVFSDLQGPIQFRFFDRDVAASCPKCRKKIKDWSLWVEEWKKTNAIKLNQCENCHEEISLYELNWRHNAAFSRCFIDVYNVYPQEAIPGEELISVLNESTGQDWDYFFSD